MTGVQTCALPISFGDWAVTTTVGCVTNGVETRTCACGEAETRYIPATGHTFGDWTVNGNVHTRRCACGATESLGHTWNTGVVTTPATEDADGVKTYTCADCGATHVESIEKLPKELGTGAIVAITSGSTLLIGTAGYMLAWFISRKKRLV